MLKQFDFYDDNSYKIIDAIAASIYWKDKKGQILGCNDYMLKMIGVSSRQDIIGKTDNDLWNKNDAQIFRVNDVWAMENGSYHGEEYVTLPNGRKKIYVSIKTPLLDNQDNIVGIVGISVDITDQKHTIEFEKHQMISNEQVKIMQIIDMINANIYWKDKEGHILGCNNYMLNMFGVKTRAEIIGKTDYDLYPKETARMIRQMDILVMQNGPHESEEYAVSTTGE